MDGKTVDTCSYLATSFESVAGIKLYIFINVLNTIELVSKDTENHLKKRFKQIRKLQVEFSSGCILENFPT